MLVGISGPTKSGKSQVAALLSNMYGFQQLNVSSGDKDQFCFATFSDLLNFATSNWRNRYTVIGIERYQGYDIAFKRPFFLMLWVDSPVTVRFKRFLDGVLNTQHRDLMSLTLKDIPCETSVTLEAFIAMDEKERFGAQGTHILNEIQYQAQLRILNDLDDLKVLESKISVCDILNPNQLRPSWDQYFMGLCELASLRSNCMKRRVGCIITSENRVISAGYNGTPKGIKNCNEGGCKRCNDNCARGSNLDTCICLHAEENALLEAGRARISDRAVTLYCNTCPVIILLI